MGRSPASRARRALVRMRSRVRAGTAWTILDKTSYLVKYQNSPRRRYWSGARGAPSSCHCDRSRLNDVRTELLGLDLGGRRPYRRTLRARHDWCRREITAAPGRTGGSGVDRAVGKESGCRPAGHALDRDRDHGPSWPCCAILGVPLREQVLGFLNLRVTGHDSRGPIESDPPEPRPVILVMVDQDGDRGVGGDVAKALEIGRSFWLCVDRKVERSVIEGEADRDGVRPPVRTDRRKARHPRRPGAPPYFVLVHERSVAPSSR